MESEAAGLGVQRYVDSPAFIDVVLGLFALALGWGAWIQYQTPDRSAIAVALLVAGAVLCILFILAQKRRTFAFDQASRTLAWTSRGLRERAGGTVAFKDVSISIEPSPTERYSTYRVVIDTPEGSWPLTTGYDANRARVEGVATRLRALVGQASDTLYADSIARLKARNDVISLAKMTGDGVRSPR